MTQTVNEATTLSPPPQRRVLQMWRTPIYQADCPGADEHLPLLRELILEAEKTDTQAANFGGIDAIKSSQTMLTWDHPSIGWLKTQIMAAATALTNDTLGEAAAEINSHGVKAEAWAVVYRSGGSLRPHTHHDSVWSGVLYVAADTGDDADEAGYLQMLDPRPAAVGRQASPGVERFKPVPGRMIAFPGWQPHSVRATASDSNLRIAIAWNVAYHEIWTGMS
ncbi:TIGR02466 family protein [Actinomadura sp. NPDC047616]|uniref:TIGR02466 family protein n=1 Tax=Actinomadura sp. NPDC047616 TaxID=3155914 RepID=UPI0033DC8ED8